MDRNPPGKLSPRIRGIRHDPIEIRAHPAIQHPLSKCPHLAYTSRMRFGLAGNSVHDDGCFSVEFLGWDEES